MLGRVKSPHAPLMACDLTSARLASHPHGSNDFVCLGDIEKIKTHLGGDSVLDRIGARDFIADHLFAPDELDLVPRSEVAKSEQRARDSRRGRAISSHRVERDASQGQASFAATRSLPA